MHISAHTALKKLQAASHPFLELFQHGALQVEIYKPVEKDLQQPHERDEVYVVISGSGDFFNGTTTNRFGAGDFIFVPAGVEHRFINFTDDFSTWVFFFGPKGGEE